MFQKDNITTCFTRFWFWFWNPSKKALPHFFLHHPLTVSFLYFIMVCSWQEIKIIINLVFTAQLWKTMIYHRFNWSEWATYDEITTYILDFTTTKLLSQKRRHLVVFCINWNWQGGTTQKKEEYFASTALVSFVMITSEWKSARNTKCLRKLLDFVIGQSKK